jgi:amidase
MELAFLSAVEQARLIRERHVTSVEPVELYLARIARLEPQLNAFVTVRGEDVLADADAADQTKSGARFAEFPSGSRT